MRKLILISLASALVHLSGCASGPTKMYEGADLPRSKVAIIKWDTTSNKERPPIELKYIDDQKMKSYSFDNLIALRPEVAVLPGKHKIGIACYTRSTRQPLGNAEGEYDFEAGKRYKILSSSNYVGSSTWTSCGMEVWTLD